MQTATPMRPAEQFQHLTLERVVPAPADLGLELINKNDCRLLYLLQFEFR